MSAFLTPFSKSIASKVDAQDVIELFREVLDYFDSYPDKVYCLITKDNNPRGWKMCMYLRNAMRVRDIDWYVARKHRTRKKYEKCLQ